MPRAIRRISSAVLVSALALSACAAVGCKRSPQPVSAEGKVAASQKAPTLRLYVTSGIAGALEPCGCVKDMLGGVDHAAAYVDSQRSVAPHALVLGAGPMLYMNAKSEPSRDTQEQFKAEALASSLKDLGLAAWAPGANDLLRGADNLAKLGERAGASVLAANLQGAPVAPHRTFDVNGVKVGVAGASAPLVSGSAPPGIEVGDVQAAAERSLADLKAAGAQLNVLLLALPRGAALRLAEKLPGYQVIVVGKPSDQGESNDPPSSPLLIGKTLVVQTPNHLQSLTVVDLFVQGGSFTFADGTGLETAERKLEIGRRLREIRARIEQGPPAADLALLKSDEARLANELQGLPQERAPQTGSYFLVQSLEVTSKLGSDAEVSRHISEYYRRVNDHNREAFKDLRPVEPAAGEPHYSGVESCVSCHQEEHRFWKQTQHSGAYATLASQHKEFNLDCVGCHVTGYDRAGGSTVTHVERLTDVQCEVCHGPGSAHVEKPQQNHLAMPARNSCSSCHHPPHVHPGWDVDVAWNKIVGPGHGR